MSVVAVASHWLGGGVFAVVSLLLLGHNNSRKHAKLLIIGCFVMALWSITSALYAAHFLPDYEVVALCDIARNGIWCIYLLSLLKFVNKSNVVRWYQSKKILAIFAIICVFLAINSFLIKDTWWPGNSGIYAKYTFLGHVLLTVYGLVLVEQLFKSAIPQGRWGIKFFCLGIGCLFAYDFYMFANGILFHKIDCIIWEVRGAASAIVAPLIGVSAARIRQWKFDFVPSRKVITGSFVLIASSFYLLLAAALGFYLKELGGTYGKALQVLVVVGSLVLLGVVLFSHKVRSQLKLFISKNFFKLKYDYREEWLNFTQLVLTGSHETLGKRIISTLADMVESSQGVLYEAQTNGEFKLKDTWNIEVNQNNNIIPNDAFILSLQQKGIIDLLQTSKNTNQISKQIKGFNWAWLVVPLINKDKLLAVVILGKPDTVISINWEVEDLLDTASQMAAICFNQQQITQALWQAKQFEGFNKLSAFVLHDLKNVVAQLNLIKTNRQKHADNPKFIASVYNTVDNLSEKVEGLIAKVQSGNNQLDLKMIDMVDVLKEVVAICKSAEPKPYSNYSDFQQPIKVNGDKVTLVNVLCHLVKNAQQATKGKGRVYIGLEEENTRVKVIIKDNGCGMNEEFIRNNLFKPFVSTKGKEGMGIGVFQAKEYLDKSGGSIKVDSCKGKGTTFILSFEKKEEVDRIVA